FTNNYAKHNGGAIDCNASKLFLDKSVFDANPYASYAPIMKVEESADAPAASAPAASAPAADAGGC
ncbi:MAG: hypothetical protein IKA90_03375, partial [Clostridia bacterium]|nr:hypothetical protein [Clostridia bacterium]